MPFAVQQLVHFADFEVDLRSGELRQQGVKIRLQEQPFRVLAALLESGGEVVTREELRRRLWPADTFVDFDHRLAAAINKVREALKDSAEHPKFVETVGRRGYRFIFPIELRALPAGKIENPKRQPEPEVPLAASAGLKMPWRRQALVGASLAVLLVLGFFILYRWRQASAAAARPNISSIAVLPLENLSNDPAQEYFVEGMTDEIITDLAQLPRLRVISHTSTAPYKGTHKSLPQIARELNVDGVVEGTVLRAGDRVRIRAQLIYAPADQHLWARAYEGDAKDVLTLQANVARDIAGEIRLKLTSQQSAGLAAPRTVDPEAHEMYLKGRFYWNKRTPESFKKALPYYEAAIQKDPNYAEAYAGLADAYRFSMNNVSPDVIMPKARAAAEKALAINPDLPEAHASLGLIAPYYDWDWDGARRDLQRAIELNPNYALAHDWYADGYLTPMGKLDESLAELRVAQRLDPLSPVILADMGKTLYFARRYDEAIAQLRTLQEMDPTAYPAAIWLWKAYVEKGMFDQALDVIEKEKPHVPETFYLCDLAYTYARMGDSERARSLLAQFLKIRGNEDPGGPAMIYVALGEKEHAFEWLEKAYAWRSNFMSSLKVWPAYDPLRNDPRFLDLERRVKLIP
jgi:TolB-like protein/DNA-binding winged helix-turn-helix (wHTH) protein